ncbi:putative transporter [Cryptosporidium canis]|nr:putative transporter [Cryptosporidium canis]
MCSLERIMDYSDKSLGKKTGTEDLLQEEAVSDRQLVDNGDARLRFVDVELSYRVSDFTGKDDAVTFKAVKGFNLELSPNEHIGIIGRTGCGKSTLIKGILGVIRPASGKILYNDVEISTLSTKKRREMIGVVPQTPLKVGDWSIRRYLDPFNEHTKESILGALKLTGLYYVIEEQTRTADIDSVRISDSNCDNCLSLTDIHLKYLNFVRLVLNKEKYRVILLDEPTIEQTEPEDGTNTPPTHQPRLPAKTVFSLWDLDSRKSRNKLGDSRQDCLDSNRNGVPGCITRLTQEGGIFERNLEWPRMSIELKRASSRNEGDLESNTNETKESASFINSLKSGSLKSSSLNSAMITSSSEPSHANARVVEVPLKESAMWIQMLIGFVTVVKATVGTGILFAPYAIVKSGYGVSIALILVYWLLNVVCTILMFQCADEANDTYSGIAAVALGRPGRILADVSITFTQLSFCAVFATFVTKAIQNVISGIHNCAPGYVEYGTALITFIQLVVPYNGVHVLCTGARVGHLEQHSGQDLTVHKSGVNRGVRWDCSIFVGIWSGGNILLRLHCGLQHPEELLLGPLAMARTPSPLSR